MVLYSMYAKMCSYWCKDIGNLIFGIRNLVIVEELCCFIDFGFVLLNTTINASSKNANTVLLLLKKLRFRVRRIPVDNEETEGYTNPQHTTKECSSRISLLPE